MRTTAKKHLMYSYITFSISTLQQRSLEWKGSTLFMQESVSEAGQWRFSCDILSAVPWQWSYLQSMQPFLSQKSHVWSCFVKRRRKATFVHKTKAGLSQEAAQWVGLELTASCSTFTWRAEAWPLLIPLLLISLYWIKYKSSGLFSHACYLVLLIL